MWHDKQLTKNGKMLIFKKANNFHSGKHLENDACFVKLICCPRVTAVYMKRCILIYLVMLSSLLSMFAVEEMHGILCPFMTASGEQQLACLAFIAASGGR